MNKFLTRGAAALFALASIAASTVPASAGGGFSFGFGSGGYGPWDPWYDGPHGGIYVDVGPSYDNSWKKHVKWCLKHHGHQDYDPGSNLYETKSGYKECNSPYF